MSSDTLGLDALTVTKPLPSGPRFTNLPLSTGDQICLLVYSEMLAAAWERHVAAEAGQELQSLLCHEVRSIIARAERPGVTLEAAA
jgi:hypothetical protein